MRPRMIWHLFCGLAVCLLPAFSFACEASAANAIVQGSYEQALALFVTPVGALDDKTSSRTLARLRSVASALRLEGQPTPLIRPAPDDTAVVVRIGYEPRVGEKLFFHRTVFLLESRVASGMRLAVYTTLDASACGVYAVAFEGRTGEARRLLSGLLSTP